MIKKEINIGIIGAGGIGALFGSIMQKRGFNVFFLKKKINDTNKIKYKVKSNFYGNFRTFLNFNEKKFYNCDIFILVTKYPHLKKLTKKLKKIEKIKKPLICLMNGLSHIDILSKIFKKNLIIATAGHVVSFKGKKFDIIHPSITPPEIILSYKSKKLLKNFFLKKIFKDCSMDVKTSFDTKKIVWEKLIRLNSLASITSLYNCNLGKIRKSRKRYFDFIELTKEAIQVAKRNGYKTNLQTVMKKVNKLPNNLKTSMQRDLVMSRDSEIDSIPGGVLRLGEKYGLKLPYHKSIIKKIKKKYEI